MVVRTYLVDNFGFDDSQLKTLGKGKQAGSNTESSKENDWGTIQILIFPAGTEMPDEKPPLASSSSTTDAGQVTAKAARQP